MKMHGLGNDFVVLDGRDTPVSMVPKLARGLADRHFGVGCDQIAVISKGAQDAHLTFYNADGSLSAACGNATRCIARHLMDQTGQDALALTTDRGTLAAEDRGDGVTAVNMGLPMLRWDEVPLAEEMDTLKLPIDGAPTATGMGNPHCTFFVDDLASIDLEARGTEIERHPLFPERTNVQFVEVGDRGHMRLRVWERGVGVTLASGSSSCAATVAASRRDLTDRRVNVTLDGGTLEVEWRDDGVWMAGRTMHVFDGVLTSEMLESMA